MKIQELLPLLKKGWVAMDVDGSWYWYKRKPYYNLRNGCWGIRPADSFPCRLPREALPIEFDGDRALIYATATIYFTEKDHAYCDKG